MPGLIRGVARTAVVAGTATAVSNRVSRRQANRWAGDDQSAAPQYAEPQYAPPPPPPQSPTGPTDADLAKLERLGKLHADGILTDEEFASQKAAVLGG